MVVDVMAEEDPKALENALDQIGRGDATPAEATLTIRKALLSDPSLAERVYAALRDVTWRTLTSRAFGTELQSWFEVFRHAAALAGKNAPGGIAEKLRACSDLIAQSARFADLQPLEEVLSRKHTVDILRVLASAEGPVKRAAILRTLGLAEANLSRVIGALSGRGLVERSASGKEANFELTDFGRQTVERLKLAPRERAVDAGEWWHKCPFAMASWDSRGRPIGANFQFYDLAPTSPASVLPLLEDWRFEVSKLARDERVLTDETWQLKINEKKWVQYVERPTVDGSHVIMGYDVSAPMAVICDLEARVAATVETEAKLRRKLAEAEQRLAAYRSANIRLREEMVSVAARSTECVRNSINALTHSPELYMVPAELHAAEQHLGAMQLAMRCFMDYGDTAEADSKRLEVLDPRQVIGDVVRTANALQGPDIDVTFGRVETVRGAVSPLRSLLGQVLIMGPKRGPNVDAYVLHADVEGSELRVTLTPKPRAHGIVYTSGAVTHSVAETSDAVASMGLGYCQFLAESCGGALNVEVLPSTNSASVTLSFPVQKMYGRMSGYQAMKPKVGQSKLP
jgi:predicted transcriptional regulator